MWTGLAISIGCVQGCGGAVDNQPSLSSTALQATMRFHETKGALNMQSHPQERIDSRQELSPMTITGAIFTQGAIRFLNRKKENNEMLREAVKPPHLA